MIKHILIASTAALGWIGLLIQFSMTIENSRAQGMTLVGGTIAYLSFFTILTNLLIAIALTSSLVAKVSSRGLFSRPAVTSALAAYIATVGIVYALLLRDLWNPEGLQQAADILLHDVVPLMFVGGWLFLVSQGSTCVERCTAVAGVPARLFVFGINSRRVNGTLSLSVYRCG